MHAIPFSAAGRRVSVLALALACVLPACHRDGPGRLVPAATPADAEAAGVRFLERITGGATDTEPLPLIVGIHGRSGRPERFSRALATLSVKARVILPYGTDPLGEGFSWFPNWSDDAGLVDGTRRAADRLAAMIAEIVRRHPTVGKPIVTGFSQGGILSFTLAVLHPDVVRTAFPISGFLAAPLRPTAWPAGKDMPLVHAFHGSEDVIADVREDRATVRALTGAGLHVELTEYEGVKHTIAPDIERDVVRAIEATLRGPGP